jgi:PEP-CTERM motif
MKPIALIKMMKWIISIIIAASLFPIVAAAQGTIIVGVNRSKGGVYPFGLNPEYTGEYQQVYASSVFQGPVVITQIAFADDQGSFSTATYNFSLGLGLTTKTPGSPGTGFGTGLTTVFSGSLSPVFTSAAGDFDFVINLTTPFAYDPAQGNLLMDAMMNSASGDPNQTGSLAFEEDAGDAIMAEIYYYNGASGSVIRAWPDIGLVTQFTIVPEPSSLSLLFLGSGVLFYARRIKPLRS